MKKITRYTVMNSYKSINNGVGEKETWDDSVIKKMLIDLSVWIPTKLYKSIPVLLPYVVRDPKCRPSYGKKDVVYKEEWGEANSDGFLRDDNSLIKSIIKSFEINGSKFADYNGCRLGSGFVACHIWRDISGDQKEKLATRFYKLRVTVTWEK